MNLTRTIKVTIYCHKINFIVNSKSRALEKPLIVMDQLWHLVRFTAKSKIPKKGTLSEAALGERNKI